MAMVYKLTFPNGKVYIGFTTKSLEERYARHARNAAAGISTALYNAWRKHGSPVSSVICEGCDDDMLAAEVAQIELHSSCDGKHGYNMTLGGEGTLLGDHNATTRARMSEAAKARFERQDERTAMSDRLKSRWSDPDKRDKYVQGALRRHATESQADKDARIAKAVKSRAEAHRRKLELIAAGDPETLAKVGAEKAKRRASMIVAKSAAKKKAP